MVLSHFVLGLVFVPVVVVGVVLIAVLVFVVEVQQGLLGLLIPLAHEHVFPVVAVLVEQGGLVEQVEALPDMAGLCLLLLLSCPFDCFIYIK